jgi:hypothetical protein
VKIISYFCSCFDCIRPCLDCESKGTYHSYARSIERYYLYSILPSVFLQRPTAKELLKFPFIRKAKKNAYLIDLIDRYKKWKNSRNEESETESETSDNEDSIKTDGDLDEPWIMTVKGKMPNEYGSSPNKKSGGMNGADNIVNNNNLNNNNNHATFISSSEKSHSVSLS